MGECGELSLVGILPLHFLGDGGEPYRELQDHEVHVGAEELVEVVALPATVLSDEGHEVHQSTLLRPIFEPSVLDRLEEPSASPLFR